MFAEATKQEDYAQVAQQILQVMRDPDMSVPTSPTLELTRHFFREFFYLGFLTDAGADSFIRLMISMLSGVLSLGILLPLLFFQKYVALAAHHDPEHYQRAILGDQLFMLCVAMFIVASVGTAICQSIFPAESISAYSRHCL